MLQLSRSAEEKSSPLINGHAKVLKQHRVDGGEQKMVIIMILKQNFASFIVSHFSPGFVFLV